MVSPDSTTIEPDWLQRLVRPVYNDNFDLVSPIYRRQKFDGALMRNLLYPMTRAIYGRRILEPYASEFAISGRLATDFLANEIWNSEWSRTGAEICLTITAMAGKYRVCQAFLGTKAQPDRGARDLVAAMRQTVGVLCSRPWITIFRFGVRSRALNLCPRSRRSIRSHAGPVRVDRKRLREMFATGVAQLEPIFPVDPVALRRFPNCKESRLSK